jgi:hypothetical protein
MKCEDTFDLMACQAAYTWCTEELFRPLFAIGSLVRNIFSPRIADYQKELTRTTLVCHVKAK